MKTKLIYIFLSFPLLCWGQAIQNGVVKEYNETKDKKPLAGVEIKVKNAASDVSRRDGSFQLSFRTLKPGDLVEYSKIEKAGYEIFNIDALESWRIANDNTPFTIVLCKSNKFKALKDQYYTEASKCYATQQANEERQLAELLQQGKIQRAEYEKQLTNIRNFYENQLDNLDTYIDRFARIDLSELSQEEVNIIQMVQDGKIAEAIQAYENMHLVEQYQQSANVSHKIDESIKRLRQEEEKRITERKVIYTQLKNKHNLMYLQGGMHNIEIIGYELKMFADQDTTAIEVVYDYARFAYHHYLLDEAEKYCRIAWRFYNSLSSSIETSYNRVMILSLLSVIYESQGYIDKAENCNQLIQTIAKLDLCENSYSQNLAMSYYNYNRGYLLLQLSDYKQALEYQQRAYKTFDKLIVSDSVKYCPLLAKTALDVALSYYKELQFKQSAVYFQKSLDLSIYANGLPNVDITSTMCHSYNGLGDCARQMGDYSSSVQYYMRALTIAENLFQHDEMRYRTHYTQVLSSLAICYSTLGEKDSTLYYAQKSLSLFDNVDVFTLTPSLKVHWGTAYLAKGLAYMDIMQYDLAQDCFLTAYPILRALTAELPNHYSYVYMPLLDGLSMNYYRKQDYQKAYQYGQENLNMCNDCYERYHNSHYGIHFCMSGTNLGYLLCLANEYDKCEEIFLRVMSFYENNKIFQTIDNGFEYARALANFALLRIHQQKYSQAQSLLDSALSLCKTKQENMMPWDQNIFLNIHTFEGLLYLYNGKSKEAVSIWQMVIKTNPDFILLNPDNELYRALIEKGLITTK